MTAVVYSSDTNSVYSGGIDRDVKGWDLRIGEVCSKFKSYANSNCPYTQGNRMTAVHCGAVCMFHWE